MTRQMMLPTASLSLRSERGQPRITRDPEKQRQLNESIALHGILQPIGVRDDLITPIWGEGRILAALAAGLKEIPAVILDKSMAEWQYHNLALVENVVRSDLSQFELWQGCVRLMEANANWQLKDLAKALSYDASTMTRIMSPSKCIPQAVEALRERKIVFGHTYAISKAESPEEQLSLLNFCLSGASRDAAEKAVRKNRGNGATSTMKVSRITCLLNGGTVQVRGEGLGMPELIGLLSDLLKAAERGHKDGMDVRAFQAVLKSKNKDKVSNA
jgi:ParB family chromosome partitioning protein